MTKRRVVWVLAAVVVLAAVAVLIPGSPVFLPNLLTWGEQVEGHSASYWTQGLTNPDGEARKQAIHNLGKFGPAGADGVPALGRILVQDDDREARIEAALALQKLASESRQVDPRLAAALRGVVPQLAEALSDPEPLVRINAAIALFGLGPDARPAIPALIQALQDDKNQTTADAFLFTIQEMAARALGRASAGTADGVPALTEALRNANSYLMRRTLALALGEVGPPARPAVPLLRPLLKDDSQDVRQAAEEALQKIGDDAGPNGPPPDKEQGKADDMADDLQLAEADRSHLWDVEHHGNLLVKHGFGPFAEALKNADAAALTRLLADDFAGADLNEPVRVRAARGFAEVERLQDGGNPPVPLDRAAFVARLLALRKVFADKPPQVKLALMTLRPRKAGRLDGPWEGTAQLRMHGEHAPGAPAEVVLQLRYGLPQPTEETLARPGWLRSAAVVQTLTARAPRYLFAEMARERGLDPERLHDNWKASSFHTSTGGVYVCDFDRDGFLDLLVTDLNGCVLYRGGPGGCFEEVTGSLGLPTGLPGVVAAWADLDGDGWDDLLVGGRVYRNEEGRHFADVTDRCELYLPRDLSNIIVADYDRDGRLDLYVTRTAKPGNGSWLTGKSTDPKGNYLLRNKGDWKFEDVTRASGAGGGQRSTFTAAWLDANNDGWPDLHVINEFGDGVLLVNNGNGTFAEHALADRPADFGSMGLAVGDVDNDGNIDVYCANMYSKAGARVIGNLAADAYPPAVMEKMRRFVAGSQLHLNKGGLQFEQAGKRMQVASVGWAYGACLADLDNDGWLDLYATAGFVSRNRDEPDG